MPEFSIRDSIITSLSAQEPWPNDVKLYQPYEVEQILLPDNANCLAVQAFLKMSNLPFEVEMRWNAEFMSPSGRVPFIKCGAFVVSELEPIVQFAANKGITLSSRLSTEEKAEMRAYMSLVTNVLHNAELYVSWVDDETFNSVTKVRNSSVYPWPLGWIQTRSKRNAVLKRLKALHWQEKTMEQVLYDVEQCCNSLSQRLGERDYFFGTPTALDALVYGHIRALLSAQGPKASLMIKPITSPLLTHTMKMSRLTNMKLTLQEDYLISQAMYVSKHHYDDKSRAVKSRLGLRKGNSGMEGVSAVYSTDVFGFKPFDKKKIIMMSEESASRNKLTTLYDDDKYDKINEILHDILDKVHETAIEVVVDSQIINSEDNAKEMNEKRNFLLVNTGYKDINRIEIDYLTTIDEVSVNTFTNSTEVIPVIDDSCVLTDDDCDDHGLIDDYGFDDHIIKDDVLGSEYGIDNEIVNCDRKNSGEIEIEDGTSLEVTDSRPTELDALVFGHIFTVITTRLPCRKLAETVRKFDTLVSLAKRVDEQYFKRP